MAPSSDEQIVREALSDTVLRQALDDVLDRLLQLRAREATFRLLAERGSAHAAAEAARHRLVRAALGDRRAITAADADEDAIAIGSAVPSPDARFGSWDAALADDDLLPALALAARNLRE